MKPILHPSLVNDPLGDPGLFVQFQYEKRALLFDLGDLHRMANVNLLKVTHVFVSHTHIDHFIGFDRLLRIAFGRGHTLRMFGPDNFIANVEGKLAGFTWNLVDRYEESIDIEVTEVHADHLKTATFRAIDRFRRSDETTRPYENRVIWQEPGFSVQASILEHRVPCLGFALKESVHLNINKDRLDALGFAPGPWLNRLKQHVLDGAPDDLPIEVPVGTRGHATPETRPLGELKRELVSLTEGQKIAYVVDTVYNPQNAERIVELIQDADVFYCESPFLAEDEERARDRCHLTSRQAGLLARAGQVRQLRTFHYSPRHTDAVEQLRQEAQDAFQGR
ncbi:ribonuclease Z [Nitrospina watsonii]|uniref:Metal-dependent hydrolases of the beta-lactamase superfamily III n=1 Tax=Nitrospina watsonii TaxID=1323948 RepID=A0ABM9HAR3_9BACT|nr:ribonuclease Z [Nitrospina watsonii]CAI2717253.1 Metal-dependent hydrolases of the beta-lactamase superfamily III [Nitrospina watsonii]